MYNCYQCAAPIDEPQHAIRLIEPVTTEYVRKDLDHELTLWFCSLICVNAYTSPVARWTAP